MHKLKVYPDNGCYEINCDYKNPALCKINGVIHAYCCICKTYIGNEYDTDWNSLIRREYCSVCREKVRTEQNMLRQKKFRKKNKQEKKLLRNQNAILKEENRLLREMVVALRDDVDKLKHTN